MTQDERWNNRYDEVVWFIETIIEIRHGIG